MTMSLDSPPLIRQQMALFFENNAIARWVCFCHLAALLCGVASVTADDTRSSAATARVNSSVSGTISPAGDVDYWRINVPTAGQLVVETTGATDTVGELQDSAGNLIEEHDDQDVNTNRNFKIERAVAAGTYYVRISAFRNSTGNYTLQVRHVPTGGDGNAQTDTTHRIPSLGDLNGDGRDDVLLRHTDGRWYYYPMNGRRYSRGHGLAEISRDQDRQFAGIGDLDGDGKDDVLLRQRSGGRWLYYAMNGRLSISSRRGPANLTPDTNWRFAGIGDLNGDGRDDVLLRHTDGRWYYYPMNGRRYSTGRGRAGITRDTDWQFAGIGDLDGDGRDDVLLRHRTDGRWLYYAMNGRESISSRRGPANLTRDTNWQFAGIGDLNGDGRDDVLLRHTNGRWYYYPMNGRRYLSGQNGLAEVSRDLDRQLAGIGDLNGDGRDDILLRGRSDGRWYYYPMNGRRSLTGRGLANLTPNLDWRVVTELGAPQSDPGGGGGDDGDTGTGSPDLTVEAPSVNNSMLTPGETFTFRASVRNRGDARSGSTTLRYYRSTNSTINSSDTQVGTDSVAGLSEGSSRSVSETLTAPSNSGTYYYGACLDSVSGESNTSNNCSGGVRVTVEAAGAPDLIVEAADASVTTLTPRESFTLSATVRNRGAARSDATQLRYRRSSNSSITSGDTQVGTDTVDSLAASGTSSESIRLNAPSGTGTYYYGACVDAVDGESDTGNNCSGGVRVTVETAGAPDLVVDVTVSEPSLSPGDRFSIDATVRNRGTARSDITDLIYFRSTNSRISHDDTEVGTDRVGRLDPSETDFNAIRLRAPSTAGTYYYGACVEQDRSESDISNNCSDGARVTVTDDGGTGGGDDTGDGDDHSNTRSGATRLSLNSSRAGRIDPGSDTDYFSVRVSESGALTVYTTGSLDTTGELQSSSGSILGRDDDAGRGMNFRIEREVGSGTYYIKVESYLTNTGSYTLHADFSGNGGNGGQCTSSCWVNAFADDCLEITNTPPGSFSSFYRTEINNRCNVNIEVKYACVTPTITAIRLSFPRNSSQKAYEVRGGRGGQFTLRANNQATRSVCKPGEPVAVIGCRHEYDGDNSPGTFPIPYWVNESLTHYGCLD